MMNWNQTLALLFFTAGCLATALASIAAADAGARRVRHCRRKKDRRERAPAFLGWKPEDTKALECNLWEHEGARSNGRTR